jgi:methylmalonyl-CoA/ethylmalonyl-CoA epimerase
MKPEDQMRFHHIGVVCGTLAEGRSGLEALFGPVGWTQPFRDDIQQVIVQFGTDSSGIRYEIIVPMIHSSPVGMSLCQGKNIFNHVAYLVPSLDEHAARLRQAGCLPVNSPEPAVAFKGARIQFFFSPLKCLVELIEDPSRQSEKDAL